VHLDADEMVVWTMMFLSSEIGGAMLWHDGEEQTVSRNSHPVRARRRHAPVGCQVESRAVRAIVDNEQQLAVPDLFEVIALDGAGAARGSPISTRSPLIPLITTKW
jgi:hypothetical protein